MKKNSLLLIVVAGVLWGTMGLFVRKLNAAGLETMGIVALRALVTAVAMFIILLIYKKELLKIKLKHIWCFIGTGVCSIVFFNFCYFKTIEISSMAVAAVLMYTAPAIVMVLSHFLFKERFTLKKLPVLLLTFLGCIFVSGILGTGVSMTPGGFFVGLGAGLGYALYSIFSRYALDRGYHSMTITFYTFLIAAIVALPMAGAGKVIGIITASPGMLVLSICFGLTITVIPYICYTLGLSHVENGIASIVASIEPVTAAILGVVVFSEKLTWDVLLGVIMVIVAIVLGCLVNGAGQKQKEGVSS